MSVNFPIAKVALLSLPLGNSRASVDPSHKSDNNLRSLWHRAREVNRLNGSTMVQQTEVVSMCPPSVSRTTMMSGQNSAKSSSMRWQAFSFLALSQTNVVSKGPPLVSQTNVTSGYESSKSPSPRRLLHPRLYSSNAAKQDSPAERPLFDWANLLSTGVSTPGLLLSFVSGPWARNSDTSSSGASTCGFK